MIEHRLLPRAEPSPTLVKTVLADILRRNVEQLDWSAELKAVMTEQLNLLSSDASQQAE